MDEPLSNLDAKLRVADAERDRLAPAANRSPPRLRHPRPGRGDDDGRPGRGHARRRVSSSSAAPQELYEQPANLFVAAFIGSPAMNLFEGAVAYPGERLYGLGQHQHGLLDQKGAVVDLVQRNTEVTIPFLVSSRGYGLLWNNPAIGRVELGANGTRWVADAPARSTTGSPPATPADVLRRYAEATGHPPMLPEWAAGFWQCKLRYRTQDELLEVAREHKRRGLPLSVIVCDFFHWTHWATGGSTRRSGPTRRHGARAGRARRQADGLGVAVGRPRQRELPTRWTSAACWFRPWRTAAHLAFGQGPDGQAFVRFYDATNPEARDYAVGEGQRRVPAGTASASSGSTPASPSSSPATRRAPATTRARARRCNLYPREHARGFHDGLRAAARRHHSPQPLRLGGQPALRRRPVVRRHRPTFDALAAQITAGLNMVMSGIPWWTTDIGGFHGGDPTTRRTARCWSAGSSSARSARCSGCTASATRARWSSGHDRRPERGLVLRRGGLPRILANTSPCANACARTSWSRCAPPRHRASADAAAVPGVPGEAGPGRSTTRSCSARICSSRPSRPPARGSAPCTCPPARRGPTRGPVRLSRAAAR